MVAGILWIRLLSLLSSDNTLATYIYKLQRELLWVRVGGAVLTAWGGRRPRQRGFSSSGGIRFGGHLGSVLGGLCLGA